MQAEHSAAVFADVAADVAVAALVVVEPVGPVGHSAEASQYVAVVVADVVAAVLQAGHSAEAWQYVAVAVVVDVAVAVLQAGHSAVAWQCVVAVAAPVVVVLLAGHSAVAWQSVVAVAFHYYQSGLHSAAVVKVETCCNCYPVDLNFVVVKTPFFRKVVLHLSGQQSAKEQLCVPPHYS